MSKKISQLESDTELNENAVFPVVDENTTKKITFSNLKRLLAQIFLTSESDPTIPSWAKSPTKPQYKTSEIVNDSGFITNAVNNLVNYYLKSDTYTRTEVNTLISNITKVTIQVVAELPQVGESNVIYLVPSSNPKQTNVKDEYIYVNGNWEQIGSTEIDLTGYATENWVNAQISDFLTEAQIEILVANALVNYYDKDEIDELVTELEAENAELQQENKNLRKASYTLNGTGENVTLNKTSENRFVKLDIKGNREQFTSTGKNLLQNTATSQTVNGITFTVNEDGTIKANGTATGLAELVINNLFEATVGNQYILNGCPSGGSENTYRIDVPGSTTILDNGSGVTFTYSNTTIKFRIRIVEGTTINNLVFKPMIRLASVTEPTYEPYTYGQAPNPNYECPVKAVGDDVNELENIATSQTINGIEFTVNADGTVKANGTATSNAILILNTINLKGSKTLSGCPKNGSASTYKIDLQPSGGGNPIPDYGSGVQIEVAESTSYNARIVIYSGTTVNNLVFKPKLQKGTEATPWSPYGMGNVNTEIVNKNWFDFSKVKEGDLNTQTGKDTAGTNVWRTSYIPVKPSTVYTIKTGNTANKRMFFYDKDKNMIYTNLFTAGVGPFTTTADTCYVRFKSVLENFASTSMLVEGNYTVETMPDYTPHQEQVYNIPCQKPMRAIGDTRDTFFKNTIDSEYYNEELDLNAWYEMHKIGNVVLDGSETITAQDMGNGTYRFHIRLNNIKTYNSTDLPNINSNYFTQIPRANIYTYDEGITSTSNLLMVYYDEFKNMSATEFKNWLSTYNPEVIYIFATPEYLKCTDAQVEALEALSKATSDYEQTNIFSINEVSPIYDTTAVADMNLVIDELSQALVANGGV